MKKDKKIALVVFGILICLFYGNTLRNGFIYDDYQQVVDNKYVKSLDYLPKTITGCTWEYSFNGCKGRAIYYRPIQSLSYLLTYQLSSQPWIFHSVNLIYFFFVSYLVFVLSQELGSNFFLSLVAGLIFIIHPANSEVVNWIAAVPELTYSIFCLLSAVFYLKYLKGEDKAFLKSAIFYFFALLSKETAILLPLIFLFFDRFISGRTAKSYFNFKEAKRYLILGAFSGIYFLMRFLVLGTVFGSGKSPYSPISLGERVYHFFSLLGRYVKTMFWPDPLIFFHNFSKDIVFNPLFFLYLILSLGTIIGFILAVKRKNRLIVFSSLWIFVFLLPVLIFIEAAGESVFSERYLFLPLVGFSFIVSSGLDYLWKDRKKRIYLASIILILFGLSFLKVFSRNLEWHDNEKLYLKTLKQNPEATPIRFNYAVLLRNDRKDFESAKNEFLEIVKRNPQWLDISMVYLHLGDYYQEKGIEEAAVSYYLKSASNFNDWKAGFALNRLGVLYAKKEDYFAAAKYFCQAVIVNPETEESRLNFDKALNLIDLEYKAKKESLYGDLVSSKAFLRQEFELTPIDLNCLKDQCEFMVDVSRIGQEVILPSFISLEGGEVLAANFDQEKGLVSLRVKKTASSVIGFFTCKGNYYLVDVKVN